MATRPVPATLERSLRARDVLVLTLSALSPAASVFVTGSSILHLAGTGIAAAMIAGGLIFNIASLLYAELGAAFPRAGGIYPGIGAVLGPRAGFVALVLGLVTAPAFLAFAALGFADYVRVLAPLLPKLPVALAALATAATLAALHVRTNAWITGIFLATELLALVVLAAVAGSHPARSIATAIAHPVMLAHGDLVATPGPLMAIAVIAGTYACAGSGLAIYFAEDLRGGGKRIGGVVSAGGMLSAVVIAVPLVLLATSMPNLASTLAADAPIPAYLLAVAGPTIANAITIAIALAVLNNVIAGLLASSRFLYATARDGVWAPRIGKTLVRLRPGSGSPWFAAIVLALAAAGFCLLGQRLLLVILSGEVFTVGMVVASVAIGRRRGLTGRTSFRAPLHPLLTSLGFLLVAAFVVANLLDAHSGRPGVLLLAVVAVVAWGWHRVVKGKRPDHVSPPPAG